AKCGHGLGLRHPLRQHITKRAKLGDFELAIAHRLDLGIVARGNEHLDLTADLITDQLADLLVDRYETRRGIVRLDAEAYRSAIGAIVSPGKLRSSRAQGSDCHSRHRADLAGRKHACLHALAPCSRAVV